MRIDETGPSWLKKKEKRKKIAVLIFYDQRLFQHWIKPRRIMIPGACFPSGTVSKATRYEQGVSDWTFIASIFKNKLNKKSN